MNAVAWDKVGKFGGETRSLLHRHDDSGQTLCGVLIPPVPVVDVVYHGEVPDDRRDCLICKVLSGDPVLA